MKLASRSLSLRNFRFLIPIQDLTVELLIFPVLKNMRQKNRRQEGPLICLQKSKGALVHNDKSPAGLFTNAETSAFNL